jgi:hypothetical protein
MAEYFLNADTGNDSNVGSEGSPRLTFNGGLSLLSSGDTLTFQDSTAAYSVGWVDRKDVSLATVTIQGEQTDASGAIIDSANLRTVLRFTADNANITIKNLTWQNVATGPKQWDGLIMYNPVASQTQTFSIDNCAFDSINMTNGGTNDPSGVFGAIFSNQETYHLEATFRRCLFSNLSNASATGSKIALAHIKNTDPTSFIDFQNCTIYTAETTNQWNAIISRASGLVRATNCIFMQDGGSSVPLVGNISGTDTPTIGTFTNCDMYNITHNQSASNNNITSDPLFVDKANNNFNLRPASPALFSGTLI